MLSIKYSSDLIRPEFRIKKFLQLDSLKVKYSLPWRRRLLTLYLIKSTALYILIKITT